MKQPSGNSGELGSSQGILDNSPQGYGLRHDDPLQAGDTCWLAVEVIDPGNEYTLARAHVCGRGGDIRKRSTGFLIHRDDLQRGSLERHRKA